MVFKKRLIIGFLSSLVLCPRVSTSKEAVKAPPPAAPKTSSASKTPAPVPADKKPASSAPLRAPPSVSLIPPPPPAPPSPAAPPASSQSESEPLEVTADSCVADENANVVQLSGRVEAIQKDLHLWADEAEGIAPPGTKFGMKNPEIVEARGQVVAKTPTQMGYADTAIYKTEEQHLHLQGKEVHLMGGDHRLTAAESADYWENDLKAVARKNVILHTSDKVIKTDELWVFFKRNEEGKLEIIFAYSPIRVSLATPDEIFIGDQGTYDPRSGMATLEGNVSVTRLSDQSRLSGAYATLDLNTGVSHVYAHPPASSKAVVVPIQGKLPEK